MSLDDTLNEIIEKNRQKNINVHNLPTTSTQNNSSQYTNENDLPTLLGVAGIGAGNMLNNAFLGGIGQILGSIGSIFDNNNDDKVIQLMKLGMPQQQAEAIYPHEDSWITSLGKTALEANNYIGDNLSEWKNELIGDNPTLAAQIFEGTGSSLGFILAGLGAGAGAAALGAGPIGTALTGALASGGLEAISESGGTLADIYRKGLYDEGGLAAANKSLAANWLLNAGLDATLGNFSVFNKGIKNPVLRYGRKTIEQVINELIQEPSQQTIEKAAHESISNGGNFITALDNEIPNWTETAKQLAPSVLGSTMLTQALVGASGMATRQGRQNFYDQWEKSRIQTHSNEHISDGSLDNLLAPPPENLDRVTASLQSEYNLKETLLTDLQKAQAANDEKKISIINERLQKADSRINSLNDLLSPQSYTPANADAIQNLTQLTSQNTDDSQATQEFPRKKRLRTKKNSNNPVQDNSVINPNSGTQTDSPVLPVTENSDNTINAVQNNANSNQNINISDETRNIAKVIYSMYSQNPDSVYDVQPVIQNLSNLSFEALERTNQELADLDIYLPIDDNHFKVLAPDNLRAAAGIEQAVNPTNQHSPAQPVPQKNNAPKASDTTMKLPIPRTKRPEGKKVELINSNKTDTTHNDIQPQTPTGKKANIITARGSEIETQYRIFEAEDLIASNFDDGRINPNYPQELQPRDRTRDNDDQIRNIALHPDPERLEANRMASDGAPVIGSDRVVESGNGRIMGLSRSYRIGKADAYRQYLVNNAEKWGFNPDDISAMQHPVLVRERLTPVNRIKFTSEANQATIASKSSSETAFDDVKFITPEILGTIDYTKPLEDNAEFVQLFIGKLTPNERNQMRDKHGRASQFAYNRASNALTALAFGDESIISRIAETQNDDLRSISKGLTKAAPALAVIQNGNFRKELLLRDDIAEAIDNLQQIKNLGKSVSEFLSQPAFLDAINPNAETLLRFFDNHRRSPNDIAQGLINYVSLANQQAQEGQGSLFEDSVRTKEDILSEALRKVDAEKENSSQNETFSQPPLNGYQENSAGQSVDYVYDVKQTPITKSIGKTAKLAEAVNNRTDNENDRTKKLSAHFSQNSPNLMGRAAGTLSSANTVSVRDTLSGVNDAKGKPSSAQNEQGESFNQAKAENTPENTQNTPNDNSPSQYDGFIGSLDINHNSDNYSANIFLDEDNERPYLDFTDENGESVAVYDLSSDKFIIRPESNSTGWVRRIEGDFRREFGKNPTEEILRRSVRQQAIDAGLDQQNADAAATVYIAGNNFFAKYSGRSLYDTVKSDNLSIVRDNSVNSDNSRGSTVFTKQKNDTSGNVIQQAQSIVKLFKNADRSTLLHELGHIFLHKFQTLANQGLLKGRAKYDWGTIMREYGLQNIDFSKVLSEQDKSAWTNANEQFASGFEKYFLKGETPSSKLRHVFEAFKHWLKDIYGSLRNITYSDAKGNQKKFSLSNEIKEVFDHLMSDNNTAQSLTTADKNAATQLTSEKTSVPKSEGVHDLDSLLRLNSQAQNEFSALLNAFHKKLGGELTFREGLKKSDRIIEKVQEDYEGDFSRVVDVLGGSLTFDNEQDLINALDFLKQQKEVVRIKDKWSNPEDTGYRDINANIRLSNGVVAELQLHHKDIKQVKDDIGHLLYDFIRNGKKNNISETSIEQAKQISRQIYEAGIDGTYSNIAASSKASLSDMARALSNQTSTREADTLLSDLSDLTRNTFTPRSSDNPSQAQRVSTLGSSSENSTANGTSSPFSKYLNNPNSSFLNGNINSLTQNPHNVKQNNPVETAKNEPRKGFFNWVKNIGKKIFSPIFSIAHVAHKPSATDFQDLRFENERTEKGYTENQNSLQPTGIIARIKNTARAVAHSLKGDFPELSDSPRAKELNLYNALNALRDLNRRKKNAVNTAMATFALNLKGLTPHQRDLFARFRLLDDLLWRKNNNPDAELPFGFDEDSLRREHKRFNAMASQDKKVWDAVQAEERTMQKINSDFVKYAGLLGINLDGVFKNPHYYRHIVIDYANAAASGRFRTSAKGNIDVQGMADSELRAILGRGYMKKYKGSAKNISTNYVQANAEVRAQMLQDIETLKTLLQLKKDFDISPRLRKQMNDNNNVNSQINSDEETYSQSDNEPAETLSDRIPDGYEAFDPGATRLIESAHSSAENLLSMSADDISLQTGIPLDKILHHWGIDEDTQNRLCVFPSEIVEALRKLSRQRHRGMLGQAAKTLTTWWKKAVLFSPTRNLKYNFRNFTGDIDALIAGNPLALRHLPRSIKDLTDYFLHRGKEGFNANQDLQDYIELSAGLGIESLNLSPSEAQKILDVFRSANNNGKSSAFDKVKSGFGIVKNFFRAETSFTEWREHLLRYAAYLDYKQQMESNQDGKPNNWGASIEDEVMSLKDIKARAFKMSNELLGAYDQVSEVGKQLRDMLVPFYSWMEVNMKRYYRLFKNAAKGGNTKNLLGQIMLGKTAAIPGYAVSTVSAFGKIAAFTLITQLFNRIVWPDADDDLPNDVKYRPHITLGKIGNEVYYFDRIGALADAADWLSLDSVFLDVKDISNGQQSLGGYVKKMLQAPFNKAINGLNPMIKMPIELAMGRSMFPDVFHPSTIRDPYKYIASSFGLTWPYKAITGEPHSTMQELTNLGIYSLNADEAAYWQTLDRVRQFQNQVLDRHFDGFASTARGRILQNLKKALRFNDREAVRRYLREYTQADGTKQGLKASMKAMNPLNGLSEKEKAQFMRWISPDDRKYLRKAMRYFHQLADRFLR